MPEMTETHASGRKPKKKKNKESHNAVERHRKEKINAGINRIGNLLPCSQALKQSKNMILDQAFRYISELKKQNDAMLLEGGEKVQAEEIRRLRRQMEELRKESAHYIELLQAHDINILEDPTVHWKGKQRYTKVAKVTPTHQIPKGIIVYSKSNVMPPVVKDSNQGKQPSEAIVLQAPVDVGSGLRVNGTLLHVNNTPAATELNARPAISQSTPGLSVVEQCLIDKPAAVSSLPPSVSYITLQLPTVTTSNPQLLTPNVATIATIPPSLVNPIQMETPVSSLTTLMQTVTTDIAQDSARTLSYAFPNNQALLQTGASGSTQTTWTTLQMAGNTVQPVCQSLPSLEVGSTTHTVQQVTVCPAVNKPSVQPIQIQMQSQIPVQQTSLACPTFQRSSPLRSTILNQTQAVLAPQPRCAVLPPQATIVSQPQIVAHPTIVSQTQSSVFQPGSLIPCPPTAIIPQAKAPTPTTLVPQPQASVLPLLQTMHVLQVNPAVATPSGDTVGQPTNNPNVVILQQANPCPAQSLIREEVINKTPCQHIVIIQAPNQSAPAAPNPQVGMVPVALPSSTTQVPTTSISTTTLQSVGGKQLVHILPRPAQPQVNKPVSQTPTASTAQTAPHTITVNGQLFSLQPLKTSDKTSSQGGQSTLQLVQPITSEEPTTNVALNSLGALSSLNQSISHGLSLSITSQNTGPSASSVVQQIQPPDPSSGPSTFSSLPVGQIHVPCVGLAKLGASVSGKKPRAAGSSKRTVSKKLNPSKKKELGHVPSTVTIPSAAETTIQKTLEHPLTCDNTTDPTLTSVSDNQNTHKLVLCNASSEASQSNPQTNTSDNAAHSDACNVSSSSEATAVNASTVRAASSKPLSEMVSGTDIKSVVTGVACSAASKLLNPEVQPTASIETSMAPSRCPSTVVSRHNRLVVFPVGITDPPFKQTPVTTAFPTPVCTTVATKVTSVQSSQQQQKPTKSSSQDLVISSSTSNENPSSLGTCQRPPVRTETNAEIVGRDTTNRSVSQHDVSASSVCPSAEVKALHTPVLNREALQEKSSTTAAEKGVMVSAADTLPSKDFVLSQQVYTNLDDPTGEHSLTSDRHADSPSMLGAGGRGFSVASMLPQGNIPAASSSFGSFTFTSEQAEMLALAMLEQDSPGKRGGACSSESSTLTNSTTTTWASTKTSVCASKEKGSSNHPKACKPSETVTAKPPVSASVRGAGEASGGLPSGGRHLQNSSHLISYSQAQVHTQSSCAASLSVNNLIKSSSNQKPYLTSSSLAGQQPSVAPPVGTSAHLSQPSSIVLSSCPSAALLNEYTHGKTSLLRAQAERQGKIIPKRQGQDEAMLNTAKRHKPCPPTGPPSGHMDVKVSDHNQIMAGPGVQTSLPLMPRTTVEGGGALFPNTFMSTVVQSADSHCPSLEQIPPGQSHIPQGHPQHSATQPAQHLGGNLYMKQHHEQQRHHLYHLQHHLMQPDTAHRHSLHQRALQQQQEQHVQKKRGMVRGGQSASPAGMQQKQHHLEKPVVQQQHSHQQQSQLQQHPQQSHPQPSHQQQTQHTQSHAQPHQQQTHPLPTQPQHQQHQQLQQQQQQQGSHSRHQQHQQQVQQHFRHQEKNCEGQSAGPRSHHNTHMGQPDGHKPAQDPNTMQRMMSSRTREQQLISPPSNPVSRSSDPTCATSRQERHRVSNYSAEALIGKSSTSGEQQQQRMGLHLQVGRGTTQEQADMRGYLDSSRGKANLSHNPQNHAAPADIQRVTECLPFKSMGGGPGAHQLGGFETQVSRGSDMTPKAGPSSQRGPQGQQQGGFRMGTQADGRNRGCYISSQGVQAAPAVLREQEACQSFMQTLLSPHLQEQSNHQRVVQCCPPVNMEYNCVPGSSSGDIQVKSSSPSVPQTQKASSMRLEGNKGHISQVNSNMHTGVRASLPHPPTPHSSSEPGRSSAPSRLPAAAGQHSRQLSRDTQSTKLRPGDRPRPGTLRPIHQFESEGHLPLPSGGGVLLSRPQSGGDGRRSTIVRFMADGGQVSADNNLVPDQHLAQNFGFPFIPEGGMNPSINANSSFIPPVSQSNSSRTPSLLPVEAQNTLPSFYPSYSPAAHPSLPSDVTLQYFPNQMFTSPSSEKGSAPPLNNRFGSILSPPRPVGFAQASFPLLPEMPPMPITNSSGITPHISNFSLTSLFPEIATGMPTDGSAMPMSPLLSLSNSMSDSGKQPNRPAHNISHILGHDGSSAV